MSVSWGLEFPRLQAKASAALSILCSRLHSQPSSRRLLPDSVRFSAQWFNLLVVSLSNHFGFSASDFGFLNYYIREFISLFEDDELLPREMEEGQEEHDDLGLGALAREPGKARALERRHPFYDLFHFLLEAYERRRHGLGLKDELLDRFVRERDGPEELR